MEPKPLSDAELFVLRDVLAAAYRRQHREEWDVRVSGAAHHHAPSKERLDILARLLRAFGSSPEAAMRVVSDDGPGER
jgi:hypothetical protein